MKIYSKDEIVSESLFDICEMENCTVITVVSKKMSDYFLSKSEEIEEMNEESVGFKMSIDGEEINFVFMDETSLSGNVINFFIDDLMDSLFSGCDFEVFCDEISEESEEITENIERMEWFVKKYVNKSDFDYIVANFFDEAKQEYALINDIEKELVDDSDVVNYIDSADFAYVTEKATYVKNASEDWIESREVSLW